MLLPLLTILLAACGSDEPEATGSQAGNATISLSDSELSVGYEAQTLPVTVRSSADWSVSSNVDWITVSPSGGLKDRDTEITIKVKENDTHEQRVGTVTIKAGSSSASVTVTQTPDMYFNVGKASYSIGAKAQTIVIPIESNQSWTASSVSTWLTIDTPAGNGSGSCSISVQENDTPRERTATIEFVTASGARTPVDITQFTDAIDVPDGYALVWNDEFNDESSLTEKWTYEVWDPGTVNNELQRYVAGQYNGYKTAEVHDGILTITARKVGSEVVSARLNSREHWTYGIIEARLNLPSGRGTWPAFWMYPYQPDGNWPYCGEIDIMEEVGTVPDEVSSSIHCASYNHVMQTQKTSARMVDGAEGSFHVYRLEWDENYIVTYVDGVELFRFANDKKGDRNTWPFDYDFKIILNLAWGGDWGGMNGVDESALPVEYHIDYVRVFQKIR